MPTYIIINHEGTKLSEETISFKKIMKTPLERTFEINYQVLKLNGDIIKVVYDLSPIGPYTRNGIVYLDKQKCIKLEDYR